MSRTTTLTARQRRHFEALGRAGARFTIRLERIRTGHDEIATRRAAAWHEANDDGRGLSFEALGAMAGLHPGVVHKAVQRYREKLAAGE